MTDQSGMWAQRIRSLRTAHGWSQVEAAERMRTHTSDQLPESSNLVRRWKAWELGENKPSSYYQSIIAATLGTVTASLFPPVDRTQSGLEILSATGMDTLEIVSRLNASAVNDATIDGLRITVDRLCSDYASTSAADLILEGRQWLRRITELQEQRLSFRQRREALELAGWLALLVGCLEYDLGDRRAAEATRKAALTLGQEVDSPGIIGWAFEMRAWFALTSGDYRAVLAATEAGRAASGSHSVSVQLIAQEAKAWARMGKRDEMLGTLETGRQVLDSLPYPENTDNHFVVDPAKFDFYAMDCLRHIGEDRLARELAEEVIRVGTDFNGRKKSPMRIAEAQVTLGVAAAREGDLEQALARGRQALSGDRKSLPSLAMVARDLEAVLKDRYEDEPEAREYLGELRNIQGPSGGW
ncbi:hypothetical protein SAMN05216188_14611 [Lentzea xinjiangensis]|uniref:HTH cro/C1-type domain-containing protein n=1 Tax=Lentzea xinjiangensis TaxID=402600 RepID=A0A1H9WVZ9_9PSEU|nr:hypothetical protein [Lentzea xinjiangensis]SES37941.1 hypothetical protein SAMN05216188_14611 [Lentzea xinjiangensis]